MSAQITAIGNEGFEIVVGENRIFIDAFFNSAPRVGVGSAGPGTSGAADLILVTHDHHDHFDSRQVIEAARRTGAIVICPSRAAAKLHGRLPAAQILALAPDTDEENDRIASCGANPRPGINVIAYRTFHGQEHNSYLVDIGGFRLFHDGDNEDTRSLCKAALGRIDALFIGPWQGSGWVEFIDSLAPRKWFMMHLTDEELEQQAAGVFLTDLCDHVPGNLVTLRPGESFVFD